MKHARNFKLLRPISQAILLALEATPNGANYSALCSAALGTLVNDAYQRQRGLHHTQRRALCPHVQAGQPG